MLNRVGTRALNQMNQYNVFTTMGRVGELQIQASTGKKDMRYSGLSTEAGRLVNVEVKYEKSLRYIDNIRDTQQSIETSEHSLNEMLKLAEEMKKNLVSALNANNATVIDLDSIAAGARDNLVAELNRQDPRGNYIYAGTRTDLAPVDLSLLGPIDVNTADTTYYTGTSDQRSVVADDSLTYAFGFPANDSDFEQLIRAFRAIESNPLDNTNLNAALGLINNSIDGLTNKLGEVGNVSKNLEMISERHTSFKLTLEEYMVDLENVDITQTITELSTMQTQLEAALLATTRLSQLSLVDFIQ